MNKLALSIRDYMLNTDIDINERLGTFFVNVGIVAAILGVVICLLAGIPFTGTLSAALIAFGAPLLAGITRHTQHPERYGSLVAVMIIFMIPVVWLTTGAQTGGSDFWFVYELFYISLYTNRKTVVPYYTAAVLMIFLAFMANRIYPEYFFHFTDQNQTGAYISMIGSGIVVTAEITITVFVQKTIYNHERDINNLSQDMTKNFVTSIANTIDSKDPYTGGHSRRVAECAAAIATRPGMTQEEIENIYFVGLLHDIGKIGVPDQVLNKPGKLSDEEFAMIRKHPGYGSEILKNVQAIPHVHDGVLYHHERYDGTGYPTGLKGEEIPFVARIITVADSYDAMSTSRIYRKSITRDEIIAEIKRCSGSQFDPYIASVFIDMLKKGFSIKNDRKTDNDSVEYNLSLTASEMMHRIMGERQINGRKVGATSVDNLDFTNIYDYLRNLSLRDGDEMVLVNITLDTRGAVPDSSSLHNYMVDLNKAITKNIRSADICTQNGTDSFMVLLLNAPIEKVEMIMKRISDDFMIAMGSTEVTLRHRIMDPDDVESK